MFAVRGWADPKLVERYAASLDRDRAGWTFLPSRPRRKLPGGVVHRHHAAAGAYADPPGLADDPVDAASRSDFFAAATTGSLSGLASLFEENGVASSVSSDVAPEIVVPEGVLGRHEPSPRDRTTSLARLKSSRRLVRSMSGQAVVVADGHVLGVEAAEGTDNLLARIADLRGQGRVTTPRGRRRSGQGAKARSGSPLRSAGHRAANRRECRARRPCRACRCRRQHDRRRTGAADRSRRPGRRFSSSACPRNSPHERRAAAATAVDLFRRRGGIRRRAWRGACARAHAPAAARA